MASVMLITLYFLPLKVISFPTDLSEATGYSSVTGKVSFLKYFEHYSANQTGCANDSNFHRYIVFKLKLSKTGNHFLLYMPACH